MPFSPSFTKSNYHVHTTFSDGQAEPEAYARRAVELGFSALGFSEHGPVPFPGEWSLRQDRLPVYLAEIERLKKRYAGKLDIRVGLEIDFLPGLQGPASFADRGLDFTLGSVHFLRKDDRYLELDMSPETMQKTVATGFCGSVQEMIRAYYAAMREMLATQPPTILAHFDLVKKFNAQLRLFDEGEAWYIDEVRQTLDRLAQTPTILEVSTAPLYRGYGTEPYPSSFILKMAREREIPVLLTSDAHWPDALDAAFAETGELLRRCGYDSIS